MGKTKTQPELKENDFFSIFKSEETCEFNHATAYLKDIRHSNWITKKGLYIEIKDVSNQLIRGNLYYESLTLNKCSFEGIVLCEKNYIHFASFFEKDTLESNYEYKIILMSKTSYQDLSLGLLEIRLFHYNNNGIVNEDTFTLSRTDKPINTLKYEQLKLVRDIIHPLKSLN